MRSPPTSHGGKRHGISTCQYFESCFTKSLIREISDQVGLTPVLDSAGSVLNRVVRASFFRTFDDGKAVQYFYEPFLESFDPELQAAWGLVHASGSCEVHGVAGGSCAQT